MRKNTKQKLHHQPSIPENSSELVGEGGGGIGGTSSLSTITSGSGANLDNEAATGRTVTTHVIGGRPHHSYHFHPHHHYNPASASSSNSSSSGAGRGTTARSRNAMRAKLVKSMSEQVDDRPVEMVFAKVNSILTYSNRLLIDSIGTTRKNKYKILNLS